MVLFKHIFVSPTLPKPFVPTPFSLSVRKSTSTINKCVPCRITIRKIVPADSTTDTLRHLPSLKFRALRTNNYKAIRKKKKKVLENECSVSEELLWQRPGRIRLVAGVYRVIDRTGDCLSVGSLGKTAAEIETRGIFKRSEVRL